MIDGQRLSALKLKSLGEADREWLLERLDPNIGKRMRTLLLELERDGISTDAAAMPSFFESEADLPPLSARTPMESSEMTIDDASTKEIQAALVGEPECVISMVMGLRRWRWQESFLAQVSSEHKHRHARHIKLGGRVSRGARAALMKLIANRIIENETGEVGAFEALMDRTGQHVQGTLMSRMWNRVSQWKR